MSVLSLNVSLAGFIAELWSHIQMSMRMPGQHNSDTLQSDDTSGRSVLSTSSRSFERCSLVTHPDTELRERAGSQSASIASSCNYVDEASTTRMIPKIQRYQGTDACAACLDGISIISESSLHVEPASSHLHQVLLRQMMHIHRSGVVHL